MPEKPFSIDDVFPLEAIGKAMLEELQHPALPSTPLPEFGAHEPLPKSDLDELLHRCRVRVAGWQENKRTPWDEEVARFQNLEDHFVRWRDNAEAASQQGNLTVDQYGLNKEHLLAMEDFHKNGGQASRFSGEHINYILRHGVIIFIELETHQGIFATIGSVCMLSAAPYTDADGKDGIPREEHGLHRMWPQYDFRDAPIPAELLEELGGPGKLLVLVRSSIRDCLHTADLQFDLKGKQLPSYLEGREVRRAGFGARGKDEGFRIALDHGNQYVTFNLGTLKHPKDVGLMFDNLPSEGHNSWASKLGWRKSYFNTIIPQALPVRPKNVNMYWSARMGNIRAGLEVFESPGGILTGKGWDPKAIEESAQHSKQCIDQDIADGNHAPWGMLS